MAAYTWKAHPGWTRADVTRMFGPGAAIIATPTGYRLGFGTVNGGTSNWRWATTADKPRTVANIGGMTQYPGSAPGGGPAAAPAAGPTPEAMPDWQDAGQQAAITAIERIRASLPAQFSTNRQRMFTQGQQELGENGLYDVFRDANGNITGFTTRVDEAGRTQHIDHAGQKSGDSITYKLTGGSEGQRYRDDRMAIAANFGSQGNYFGSARADAQKNQQAALNDSRAAFERNLTDNQRDSVSDETAQWASMGDQWNVAQGNYGTWKQGMADNWTQAKQAAGSVSPPPGSSPSPAAGSPTRSVRPTWVNKPNQATITARYGPSAKLIQAGNGKWTITNWKG
jgi:hypothetical protein